jgi:hypothetical protein
MPTRPAPRVSHVPIEGGVSPALADEFLKDRLQQAQTAAEVGRLLKDLADHPAKHGLTREDQQKLTEALGRAGPQPENVLQDPEVQEIILKAAKNHQGASNATPEDKRRWAEFANRLGPLPNIDPPDPTRPGEKPFKPPDPTKPGEKPTDPTGPNESGEKPFNPPPPDDKGTKPANPPAPDGKGKRPAGPEKAGRLSDFAERLADSPTVRRLLANMDRAPSGAADWDKRRGQLEWLERRFADLGTRLPNVSWPKVSFSPPRERPSGGAVGVGRPDLSGGGGQLVLLLLAAATAGLLAWGLLRRPGGPLLSGAGGGRRLGPWPVRPEAVRTRDELVRAFEYLALLLLGPAARSRNHREIAASLGETGAARRAAAERLAGLYEQARYAPPDEALPDADLAAARAALSLLAGVAAA